MKQEIYNLWSFVLGVLTFLALVWYTVKTHQMQQAVDKQANEINRQIKLSIMPAFTARITESNRQPGLVITNIGKGFAINVEFGNIERPLPEILEKEGMKNFFWFESIPVIQPNDEVPVIHRHHLLTGVKEGQSLWPLWNGENKNLFYDLRIKFQDVEGTQYSQLISIGKNLSKPGLVVKVKLEI